MCACVCVHVHVCVRVCECVCVCVCVRVWAKYMVMVSKLLSTNWVQAHDDCLKVPSHINLYLSTTGPRTIGWQIVVSGFHFFDFESTQVACQLQQERTQMEVQ